MSFENPSSVDDLLNYRIARLLSSSGALVIRICEGRYGISRREWRLIALLHAHGALSPSELAAHAHTDRALVSRAVNDLAAKHFVVRLTSPSDRRRATIELTPKGHKLYDEFFPETAGINGRVLQILTPEQLAAFDLALTLLTKQAETLSETDIGTVKANRRHGGSRRLVQSKSELPGPQL